MIFKLFKKVEKLRSVTSSTHFAPYLWLRLHTGRRGLADIDESLGLVVVIVLLLWLVLVGNNNNWLHVFGK